ncbi:MAG: FadR/GntR family transcriptional regulator [Propionivibrio sp.]
MFEREPVVGTMSSQVARIIGTKIVGGEYAPGDSLPIEGDLCTQYGVSRTTIREAIKHLAGKRLIDVQPKIGTRVLPFNDWNLLDREVLSWRLTAQFDSKIVEDIFEMRLCFEPRASYLAARYGSDDDHRLIEKRYTKLAGIVQSGNDVRLAAQADLEFHMTIINLSQNGMFITIGSAIKAALRVSSEMLQRHATHPSEDLALYDDVRSRIVRREAEAAAEAMTRLLKASLARVLPITTKI